MHCWLWRVLVFSASWVAAAGAVVARGPWVGGVTERGAVIVAQLRAPVAGAWLEMGATADFAAARRFEPAAGLAGDAPETARVEVTGLAPGTRQFYRWRRAGVAGAAEDGGEFVTFPVAGAAAAFRFAFGSCAETGSAHRVFTQIAAQAPLFFLHTGDLHYENIARAERAEFRAAYAAVLGSPTQAALYRAVPVVYTWDDHDYGPNGSDRFSPSREAALATYREYVPHYPLAWDREKGNGRGPITQAFTVGRVRFLVLDTRSRRDPVAAPDDWAKSMLGAWQRHWLKQELRAARGRFPLVFVVSSVAWVSDDTGSGDNWGRYATERAELSEWMVAEGVRGVCFLGGDAHMLAADDGTHDAYAAGGGPGFPALQAASLDRKGSRKGGPWSVAPVLPERGEGQFGLVEVTDRGGRIAVRFRGLNQEAREKLRFEFSVPAR